jgi:Lectin C-type domain
VRLALPVVFLAGIGCGKQLNADFCDAHPADDRCLGGTVADVQQPINDVAFGDVLDGCPSGYDVTLTSSSSKYRMVDITSVLWHDAEADCEDDGTNTHLIVINNNAERLALGAYNSVERHVGYSDANAEGVWIPITDDPNIYTDLAALQAPPWLAGEPNEGTAGSCMIIMTSLDLRDRICSEAQPVGYACECDGYPANPANF